MDRGTDSAGGYNASRGVSNDWSALAPGTLYQVVPTARYMDIDRFETGGEIYERNNRLVAGCRSEPVTGNIQPLEQIKC